MKAEPQKELRVSSLRPVKSWDSKDPAGSTRFSAVQSPCLCQSETQSLFESSLQLSELPTRSWIKKPVSRQASFVLQCMSWLNWSSNFSLDLIRESPDICSIEIILQGLLSKRCGDFISLPLQIQVHPRDLRLVSQPRPHPGGHPPPPSWADTSRSSRSNSRDSSNRSNSQWEGSRLQTVPGN